MKIEQIYTGCLAEAAYYVESEGEALIIDPLRETKPYMDRAAKDKAVIKYILETHFHADFVSGHLDLAAKTGAAIVFGPTAAPGYPAYIAKDGEELKLGKLTIRVLHTPGHTMESSSYLLLDEQGKPTALFTGDTLFIGDVGRPDLVQKLKKEITPEFLAGQLFDSLRTKIMPLPDDIIVYPGHGAGSACGKNMSKETTDTLGNQKKTNYALQADMPREEFIKEVTGGLVAPPQYFPHNVLMNVSGGLNSIDQIIRKGTTALDPTQFQLVWETEEALVIDTRSKNDFPKAFLPGAIFIGLDDNFAPWVGTLVTDLKQPILLLTDAGKEEEAVIRLARVGYDNTLGYLKGGITAWKQAGFPIDSIDEIDAAAFARMYEKYPSLQVLDVRRASEYASQHIEGTLNFPLDFINSNMGMLDKNQTYYVHCAGGYRSVITASILKARGYHKLVNIQGGFAALSRTSLPTTAYQAPTTML
ncbi:MBL fold metallo-hydrolase [Flavihumibacter sp. CACIAM 22H1]|uniref:MBL fold metallo-hydrolase n=1 Tax=Flavihumibacter sp. CACIAM 22H1 TaxID=1812911 RepID=UPI0007A8387E|nr:MBL fold metallo-hydrolase [Flavihumibacter sp. CACIAM 22H1]KYP14548.1 MAG: MBL fold metallo-hydrolase [Flavihumibacter sp. CACIAM 22H1]